MTTWVKKAGNEAIKIRAATDRDLSSIKEIYEYYREKYKPQETLFSFEFRKSALKKDIRKRLLFICEVNNEVIGFSNFILTFIKEKHCKKGIGAALLAVYLYVNEGSKWEAYVLSTGKERVKKILDELAREMNLGLGFFNERCFYLKMKDLTKNKLNKRIENFLKKNDWKKVN